MIDPPAGTVVIGGSQAGLAVGYFLKKRGLQFVILDENERIGDAWRKRWDSLRLFTPAGYSGLPGTPCPGRPWAYPTKNEVADYLEAYARELPVRTGVKVDRLSKPADRFNVTCGEHTLSAENVVVATGAFNNPRVPSFARELDTSIVQLHSREYRNSSQIQKGAMLVVGAGNSGAEIATELAPHHQTWLSSPDTGQEPARAGSRLDLLNFDGIDLSLPTQNGVPIHDRGIVAFGLLFLYSLSSALVGGGGSECRAHRRPHRVHTAVQETRTSWVEREPLGGSVHKRMKNTPLTSVIVMFAGLSHAALSAQERAPVIDMHMHAHHIPLDVPAGAPPPCLPRPCQPEGAATATPEESLRKTLEAMDRNNIVLGFLSSANLDIVMDWVAAAPDRFIASPFIEAPGELTPQMLRQEYRAGRLAGMGEIGSQLMGVAPDDPVLAPYFALAEEFDVPVLIHTEGIGPPVPGFRSAAGRPLLLEEVLVRHRNLRVFVENSGYPFLDEMIAMMYQYPQLYGDLSTITWVIPRRAFHRYVEALVRAGLGNRLMFGSDQMRWPEKIDEAIEAIEEADYLTAEQKRDILYNNAARFLRLEGRRK